MKTAIIGAGIAGVSTAKRLKALLPEEEITLYDQNTCGLYAKMRLPEYLAGKLPREKLMLASEEQLRSLGIRTEFGRKIIHVDPLQKTLCCENQERFSFDRLIFASGANAFVPDLPGFRGNPAIATLRTLADADALISSLASSDTVFSASTPYKSVLVLGGGLLGLEAAWALKTKGMDITILEMAERLLPKQLNTAQSLLLERRFRENGFHIELNVCAESAALSEDGLLTLSLKSGQRFHARKMLVSAGIRSETADAAAAGLRCGRGILTDQRFQTSDSCIYAVGDCAEVCGRTPGLWLAAKEEGEALAEILAGARASFEMPDYRPKLKITGIDFQEIMNAEGGK